MPDTILTEVDAATHVATLTLNKPDKYNAFDAELVDQWADALDRVMAGLKQIRVFVRDAAPLASVQRHLAGKGEGEASLVLMLEEGKREVEMRLPGRYAVTPQIASALRAVRGVVQVELV